MYVLDTSALFAFIENEDGVAEIERFLMEALENRHTLYVSVVSCIEVFYFSLQEQGLKVANERLALLKDLPFIQESLDENDIAAVGEIKASHGMSFADCCVAGLAKKRNAVLIHKDPEFEQVERQIPQLKLPYKPKNP